MSASHWSYQDAYMHGNQEALKGTWVLLKLWAMLWKSNIVPAQLLVVHT